MQGFYTVKHHNVPAELIQIPDGPPFFAALDIRISVVTLQGSGFLVNSTPGHLFKKPESPRPLSSRTKNTKYLGFRRSHSDSPGEAYGSVKLTSTKQK